MSPTKNSVKTFLDEIPESTLTVKLGETTKAGLTDMAKYYGTSAEHMLRIIAILPAALFKDVKSETKVDKGAKIRAECTCTSKGDQLASFSYYWLKGVNSVKSRICMKSILEEPLDMILTVKLGKTTRMWLNEISDYCEMGEAEFLRSITAIFARTLIDVKSQGEYDTSADMKAVVVFNANGGQVAKAAHFIFRPGVIPS